MLSLSSPKSHVSQSATISKSCSRIWSTIHRVLFLTDLALIIAPDSNDLHFVETAGDLNLFAGWTLATSGGHLRRRCFRAAVLHPRRVGGGHAIPSSRTVFQDSAVSLSPLTPRKLRSVSGAYTTAMLTPLYTSAGHSTNVQNTHNMKFGSKWQHQKSRIMIRIDG